MNIDLETVILVNKLHNENMTRSKIMSITGLNAFQVQACLIKNFPRDNVEISIEELLNFNVDVCIDKNWQELLTLTEEEDIGIKKFMEEEYE